MIAVRLRFHEIDRPDLGAGIAVLPDAARQRDLFGLAEPQLGFAGLRGHGGTRQSRGQNCFGQ
jgi:hypothetical protein